MIAVANGVDDRGDNRDDDDDDDRRRLSHGDDNAATAAVAVKVATPVRDSLAG